MSARLAGKVAIVTGASKGIGAAIAVQLAKDGASVVVNYASSRSGADAVVAAITKSGGKAIAIQADVSKEADVRRLFAESLKALGPADVLVNNAGIYSFAPLEEVNAEHFHSHFDLNVLGLLLPTKEAVKQFADRGGSIVNISSVVAKSASPNAAVYCATKAAVDAITVSLAKELGPRGIRVNSVNPGLVVTEGTQSQGISESEWAAQIAAQTPLRRLGQPGDIGPVVSFIASDEARWVSGEALLVSGGLAATW